MRATGFDEKTEKILCDLESFAVYNEQSGGFIVIKRSRGHRPPVGSPLGTLTTKGYLYAKVCKRVFPIHHLVWLWHKGYLPKQIDHEDRNKQNNRISNLREVSTTVNMLNRSAQANNKLGLANIKQLPSGKYHVRLFGTALGTFNTISEAIVVRNEAKHNAIIEHINR